MEVDFSPFPFEVVQEPEIEYKVSAPARSIMTVTSPGMKSMHILTGNNGNNTPAISADDLNQAIEKRRSGRMSLFTEDIAARVIEAVEDGRTMADIAQELGVHRNAIWTWMQLVPAFHSAVTQAREYQGHSAADQAVEILDNVALDKDDPKSAMAELRKAEQRARIRMDLAKCFNFKQYGDKKQNLNLNLNADVCPIDLGNYI